MGGINKRFVIMIVISFVFFFFLNFEYDSIFVIFNLFIEKTDDSDIFLKF